MQGSVAGGMRRYRRGDRVAGVPLVWWPATIAALALLAGLIALAATPGAAAEPVTVYAADERPSPIPLDPGADRLVDLNRASRAELEALPGIGAVRAAAIIGARETAPFASMAEVAEREVVPAGVLAELEGLATARPASGPEPGR